MISAIVMTEPDAPLELQEFDRPELEPGAVLLKTLGSEVCGTDAHLWKGQLAGVPYPIIPGHVSVGQIAALGPAHPTGVVRDVSGAPLQVGQIVTFLDVYGTCGRCWYCTVGHATTRCPERKVYGVTLSARDGLLGGWSEYIHLKPGVHVIPLPAELVSPAGSPPHISTAQLPAGRTGEPPEYVQYEGRLAGTPSRNLDPPIYAPDSRRGTLDWRAFLAGGCGMPTALHAVTLGEVAFGDTVVVQGAGPVGLCAAVLAQLRGAGQVIVVGGPEIRLAAATRFGADAVIDIGTTTPDERLAAIRAATGGRGADVTIEATGVPAAVPEGMRLTRDAGRYVVVGQYTDVGNAMFNPHLDLNQKHLDIRGCWGSDVGHVYRSVQVMARYGRQFPWADLITRQYALDEAQTALEDVAAQRVVKALIVP